LASQIVGIGQAPASNALINIPVISYRCNRELQILLC